MLCCTWSAVQAVQTWRILALRVDFPVESPDELSTTGSGGFDLRPLLEALPDYRFPYDTPPHDRVYFEQHLEALARYYRTVSNGEIEIEYAVFPPGSNDAYTLPQHMLDYGNGRTTAEIERKWGQLFRDAVAAADVDEDGPVFSEFNSFLIFHAGVGHETGQLNDIRSVYFSPADLARFIDEPLLVDEGQFELKDGWILPETLNTRGQIGLNGLLAKFFGHQLGLPGLSNFADGLPALGGWSLMDVGANRLGYVLQDTLQPTVGFVPPHLMAWSKARLGWIEPLEVVRDTTIDLLAADRLGELPQAVRLPIDADEYFLLENRQQRGTVGLPQGTGGLFQQEDAVWLRPDQIDFSRGDGTGVWLGVDEYDAFVPGSGVLVWHVDDAVIEANFTAGSINDDPVFPGIALEEADGYRDIGQPIFDRISEIEGASADPFYVGGQTIFGAQTRPDSRSNRGLHSGIEVEVLSPPGDIMRVEIRFAGRKTGWPQQVVGGRKLQALDLDGDGAMEMLVEAADGVRIGRVDAGMSAWSLEGARLLASGDADADGQAEIFVARGAEVSAWREGERDPLWTATVEQIKAPGLFTDELAATSGRAILALLSSQSVVLLNAVDGQILRQDDIAAQYLAAADWDGDGELELIAAGIEGVWGLDTEGVERLEDGEITLPLSAGDVDGDGKMEIVAVEGTRLRLLGDGGGGFVANLGDSLAAAPIVGDVDGDGFLEVVAVGTDQVHIWRHNGIQQVNFPLQLARFTGIGRVEQAPILADVDGDGKQDILLGTRRGLFGIRSDGRQLPGFPLLTVGALGAAPVSADLDGDGLLDLAGLGGDLLYVWDVQALAPLYNGRVAGWGQEGAGAAGLYTYTAPLKTPEPIADVGLLPKQQVYCYPNPVKDGEQAHVRFFLNQPARVELQVFDALGQRVEKLIVDEGMAAPTENEIAWSTEAYASGLYLCRLEAKGTDGGVDVAIVKMAVSR